MLHLEEKVADFISRHQIFYEQHSPILVALSGGADSVALLALLTALGYRCIALHCNFHLRGKESDRDQRHAQQIATRLGCECQVLQCDVDRWRLAHGGSVEMACREIRYKWFADSIIAHNAQAVSVAHNLTDNIETFFINLLRGTSLAGLTGMSPIDHSSHVARPLLSSTRDEIEAYLKERDIEWINDSSNYENIYRRNCIRNEILPEIRKYFENADARITDTMLRLRQNDEFYREALAKTVNQSLSEGAINLEKLCDITAHPELVIFEWLKSKGASYTQAQQIIEAKNNTGAIFKVGSYSYLIDRGWLRKVDNQQDKEHKISFRIISIDKIDYKYCPNRAYFSADISPLLENIEVRSWQAGDRIKPWGMRGSKKLSDIFSDAKISRDRKDDYVVVTIGDEIIWVAGLCNSRLYPVKDGDTEVIELSID